MATAVLRSHDCLQNSCHQNKFNLASRNPNPGFRSKSNNNTTRSSGRRRKSPPARATRDWPTPSSPPAKGGLVMEQVKILKRGEGIDLMIKSKELVHHDEANDNNDSTDIALCSTDRLGPEPKVLEKQIKVSADLYAGSASLAVPSPPPSSLPFPTALVRTGMATSNLRKMLRI